MQENLQDKSCRDIVKWVRQMENSEIHKNWVAAEAVSAQLEEAIKAFMNKRRNIFMILKIDAEDKLNIQSFN